MDTKINKLLNDSEFKSELDRIETEEEIKALFEKNGVRVEFEYENPDDELSEHSLENVAGGRIIVNPWIWKRIGKGFVKCILIA